MEQKGNRGPWTIDCGPKGLIQKSLFISVLFHAILLGLLIFGLPGDVERPAGYGESEIISVSIVSSPPNGFRAPASPEQVRGGAAPTAAFSLTPPIDYNPQPDGRGSARSGSTGSLAPLGGPRNNIDGGEGGTSSILQQIRNRIERQKHYPLFAKRSQIEGSPLIEFKIKPDGSLEYVLLQKSSGHKILDESAVTTVRQAAPYPFYPEPIALNIHYTLAR